MMAKIGATRMRLRLALMGRRRGQERWGKEGGEERVHARKGWPRLVGVLIGHNTGNMKALALQHKHIRARC